MAKTKKCSNSIKAKPKDEIKMLQKLIKKAVKTFEVKIKDLEENFINQMKDHQIKVNQEEVYGASTSSINDPRQNIVYNIHNVTIEKPKFENGNTHPVTFLEDLTSYLKKVPSNGLEISIAQECLVGEAKYWARINSVRWTTFDDFKADFLRVFWGEEEQNKVKRFLVQNKWNRCTYPTMVSYFLYVIEKAQTLSYPIPEKQLVTDVIRHYPKTVQQLWRIAKIETIIETTDFLRNLDDIDKQDEGREPYCIEKKRKLSNYNTEQKHKEIQQSYKTWRKPDEGKKKVNEVNEIQLTNDQLNVLAPESNLEH